MGLLILSLLLPRVSRKTKGAKIKTLEVTHDRMIALFFVPCGIALLVPRQFEHIDNMFYVADRKLVIGH